MFKLRQFPDAAVLLLPAVGAFVGQMRQRLGAAVVDQAAGAHECRHRLEDVAIDAMLMLARRAVARQDRA